MGTGIRSYLSRLGRWGMALMFVGTLFLNGCWHHHHDDDDRWHDDRGYDHHDHHEDHDWH